MSKAFDVVDHDILLNKLESYDIRGNVLKWFVSYLSERKHLVEIEYENIEERTSFRSSTEDVKKGVPQGSILGPLLFILFINDLSQYIKHGKFINFADDANIAVFGSTIEEMEQKIIDSGNDMKNWCDRNS